MMELWKNVVSKSCPQNVPFLYQPLVKTRKICDLKLSRVFCSLGGPQVRFSLGAGDRQALQPPISATIPISNTVVSTFFHQMGKLQGMVLFA